MTNPLDSSDLASLIQADWHEEFGDIDYANEIRESVLEPKITTWDWTDEASVGVGDFGGFGVGGVGGGGDGNWRGGIIGSYGIGVGGIEVGGSIIGTMIGGGVVGGVIGGIGIGDGIGAGTPQYEMRQ